MRRYAHRRDLMQSDIVGMLNSAYFSVLDLSMVGNDCPDLLVGKNGVERLVEIKSDKSIHHRASALSEGQAKFKAGWRGAPVVVAQTLSDVMKAFQESSSARNVDFLQRWMRTPNPMLGNVAPLKMMLAGLGHRVALFIDEAYRCDFKVDVTGELN